MKCTTIFYSLLKNFEAFFNEFLIKEGIINCEKEIIEEIKKTLYWNLYVFYYNLYVEMPILQNSSQEFKIESISYLNHLVYNYFDFCNFMNKDENKEYYCDILENGDFNPLRSESIIKSADFTT
jgi:hypothetical protein